MNSKTIILILCLIVICLHNTEAQIPRKSTDANKSTDPLITLERSTDAFGVAHAYKLFIYETGTVIYKAEPYNPMPMYKVKQKAKQIRTAKSKISQAVIQQLLTEFDRINFFQLKDRYSETADGCASVITDQSTVRISLNRKGKKKSITHNQGCVYGGTGEIRIFPKVLYKLEGEIDRVVGTKKWIK